MKNSVKHIEVKTTITLLAIGMFFLIGNQALITQTPTTAKLLKEGDVLLK